MTQFFRRTTPDALRVYWMLLRITVPLTIAVEIMSRWGVIDAIAPAFAPVMTLIGLPPELGLAVVTAMLVGLWGAVPLLYALVPAAALTTADVTVFSALILFAHGLPLEQKIIQAAGPRMAITTVLRVAGGLLYAFVLHRLFEATGWLQTPVAPAWVPLSDTLDWQSFALALAKAMGWMLVILLGLTWGLELLKRVGVLDWMMKGFAPCLRLCGIEGEAVQLTAIGLCLGISYGAGLLIREVQAGAVPARQVFLACVFMGFAHSLIEDSLLVIALGAEAWSVVAGRFVFAVVATGVVAQVLRRIPERAFLSGLFKSPKAAT